MSETRTSPGPEGPALQDKKLVSWKEIASHLGREVRTVQRWERSEGLPVYRHEHLRKSTVYAFANELDDWIKKRQPKDDPDADAAFEPEPDVGDVLLGSENGDEAKTDVPPVQPSPPKWKRPVLAAAAAAVLCFAGYGVYRWIHPRILPPEKVRLVVLPFKNLSGDPKQDYFSAGLTDEMITRLGNLDPHRLGVIAAESSNRLSGKPLPERAPPGPQRAPSTRRPTMPISGAASTGTIAATSTRASRPTRTRWKKILSTLSPTPVSPAPMLCSGRCLTTICHRSTPSPRPARPPSTPSNSTLCSVRPTLSSPMSPSATTGI